MKEKRRKYSAKQKVSIVRELLEGGYSISDISEKYQIHPSQLNRWKKQLFEGALETFSRKTASNQHRLDKELEGLKSKLSHKDGIIVELLEDNLRLKKNDGDY
jgi:transposase-like protein